MADLNQRTKLSVEEYEKIFFEEIVLDEAGNSIDLNSDESPYALEKVVEFKRIYHS